MNIVRKWSVSFRYYLFKMILPFPKIMTKEETLELLINSNKSIARYGDGEFHMLGKSESLGFQQINTRLSERLKEILNSENDGCLISLPLGLNSVIEFNAVGRYFWKQFIVFHYRKYIPFIDLKKVYGNANVTRPYIDFVDHSQTSKFFDRMKELWRNKDILIIEGEMSKLGVGNDFFAHAKSIQRIITLPKDAFKLYDKILHFSKDIVSQYDLVLVSLGPTATVLAYDLSFTGVQVIDIGHIDLEYEWFLRGAKEKVPIAGKHVNELSYDIEVVATQDAVYLSQIVMKILD